MYLKHSQEITGRRIINKISFNQDIYNFLCRYEFKKAMDNLSNNENIGINITFKDSEANKIANNNRQELLDIFESSGYDCVISSPNYKSNEGNSNETTIYLFIKE